MKLYLDKNIAKGTPEELAKYKELISNHQLDRLKEVSEELRYKPFPVQGEADLEDFFKSDEFYRVIVGSSDLPKGTVIRKMNNHTHADSTGEKYLYVGGNALEQIEVGKDNIEDRFNFAKQLGIRLMDSTDLSHVTEGKYFKVTEEHSDLSVGDVVTIAKDDRDNQPQCKDKHGNFHYVYFRDLELVEGHEEAEDIVVEDSMHDEGAFYTVTEEAKDSPLTVGTILQHQHGNLFIDSIGHRCRISRPSFVERGLTHGFEDKIKQDRFELAKELGIHLTSSTNFAVEASDRTFKLKEEDTTLTKGELVKIIRDDSDRLPLVQSVEDSDRRRDFVYISKLEVVQDTFRGIFGSVKIDKSSIGSTESSTDEEESPSTELKVGDRVKVLKSEYGAEEEATVTAVLEDGDVELAGTSKSGKYLTNWSNHASNLKKIEEKPLSFEVLQAKAYLEDKSIEQVVEEEQSKYSQESTDEEKSPSLEAHKYYEVIDNGVFADSIEKGTVVKAGNYNNLFNCITSDGIPQVAHPDELKLLQGSHIKDRFEFAEMTGVRLTFSTDLAEECKDHLFQLTHDEGYSGSAFSKGTAVKIDFDDGSSMPRFKDEEHEQFVYLGALKEIARPSK